MPHSLLSLNVKFSICVLVSKMLFDTNPGYNGQLPNLPASSVHTEVMY